MIYINLVIGFLKVGCFAFGGAYGAIPLIREIVLSYAWLTEEELTYMIAVSESTPGPIMVNLATYIGSSQAGFWGAVLSTIAVILPSFFMVLLLMIVLKKQICSCHTSRCETLYDWNYICDRNVYDIDKYGTSWGEKIGYSCIITRIVFVPFKLFTTKDSRKETFQYEFHHAVCCIRDCILWLLIL